MKKLHTLSLTLASLLILSNVLPLSTAAKINSHVTGSDKEPRKSQIKGTSIQKYSINKIPKHKISSNLLEKKFNSKSKLTSQEKSKYRTDELIVQYKKNTTQPKINSLKEKFSLKQAKLLKPINAEVVKIPKGKSVVDFTKELKKDPSVETAQPNYKYYPTSTNSAPNYYSQLWGLNNSGQSIMNTPGMADIDVDAPEARTKFSGKLKQVLVGVLDTGIDINHPDLQNNIWTNPGEIPNDGIDNDHNGYVDDVHGWDFYNKDNSVYDPLDGEDHGTHVSGTIAASLEGTSYTANRGVVGVAPNVKIVPLKFLGPDGGTSADAIAAIEYAQKLGIKILNNSWGGIEYDPLLEEAIRNYEGLFVVAAGNDGTNNDSMKTYPASYSSPNIISVAALDNQGTLASFSNFGAKTVDIAAPGVDILSTVPKFPVNEVAENLGVKLPGASAQVSNDKYKAIFDGIGFEKYSSNTEKTDAFTKSLNFLDISKDKNILLVQDDEHDQSGKLQDIPELQNYFKDYLSDYEGLLNGYHYKTVTINANSSIKESGVDLSNYDAVIWFTGHGLGLSSGELKTLTAGDITALTSYLQGGGRLLLTGQDALSGNEDSSFVTDLLHLKVFPNSGPILNVEGITGGIYADKNYAINRLETSYQLADFIDSTSPETVVNLTYVSDYNQAYNYESGTSMAAPHVTGAAAILAGLYPNMSPQLLKLYLINKGKNLPQLEGLVNSSNLVKEAKLSSLNDNDFPGVPLTKNIYSGSLDASTDKNDVYAVPLNKGESVKLTLSGKNGTDYDLYVYDQTAKNIKTSNDLVGYSENAHSSKEKIEFTAPKTGIYFIDVYAYKGAGYYILKFGNFGGTYEDGSKLLSYSGSWNKVSNRQLSNGTARSLNSRGEADFTFTGYSLEWQGFKDPSQGIADVYMDGIKVASPSLFSTKYKAKQTIYRKTFSYYGQHHVRIVWTGKSDKTAKKNGAALNIDRLIVTCIPTTLKTYYDAGKKHPVISWTSPSWAASYNVYRRETPNGDFKRLNRSAINAHSFVDTSAVLGKTYQYAVSFNTKDNQETGASTLFTFHYLIKGTKHLH